MNRAEHESYVAWKQDETHFLFQCQKLYWNTLKLYEKIADIVNLNDNMKRMGFLNSMPHLFGNYVDTQWRTRNELLNNVYNNP